VKKNRKKAVDAFQCYLLFPKAPL